MIKMLQKRFLVTAMTAVSVLILVMLGAINIANYAVNEKQLERTLYKLAENDGQPRKPFPNEPPRFEMLPDGGFDASFTQYVLVRFDVQGNMVYVENCIDYMTEDEAKSYASEIYNSAKKQGRKGYFRYAVFDSRDGRGCAVVFINSSVHISSMIRMLIISVVIGFFGWLGMLCLVRILSRQAIMPIAQNIEKQRQFVTNAGHEIKTPLAIILANVDAMELHTGENKWSRNIRTQTARLDGLMQNLLLLSKTDEGMVTFAATQVCVSELLQECIESYREPAELKNIKMQTDIAAGVVKKLNRENLEQLFSILLDNAIKYTPKEGQIRIVLRQENKRVKIQFSNTCDKLPQEDLERLFERFYRADSARTQKNGGYGIGLSVARAITESFSGKIYAQYGEDKKEIIFVAEL